MQFPRNSSFSRNHRQHSEFSGRLSYQKVQVQNYSSQKPLARTVTFSNFGSAYTLPKSPTFLKRGYSFSLDKDNKNKTTSSQNTRIVHFSDESKPRIPYISKREKSVINDRSGLSSARPKPVLKQVDNSDLLRPHTTIGSRRYTDSNLKRGSGKYKEPENPNKNVGLTRGKSGILRPKTASYSTNQKFTKNVPKINIEPPPVSKTRYESHFKAPEHFENLKIPDPYKSEQEFQENQPRDNQNPKHEDLLNSSLQSMTLEKFIYKKTENQRVTDKIEDWFNRAEM